MPINPDGLCDTKLGLESSPCAPGKGMYWKACGVGALPRCLTAMRTRGCLHATWADRELPCLPSTSLAASFTEDQSGTPGATPVHVLPDRELGKGPSCEYRLEQCRLMNRLSRLINAAARSRQNSSCSTAQHAPGLLLVLHRLPPPCQAQLAEEKSTCVKGRCHFTRGNETQMSDHT